MTNFETPELPFDTDEETFRQYMENLDLSPGDFDKTILDVGSGSGQFAKWAKEHHVSDQIYSLEPFQEGKEKSKLVRGNAEAIPFQDESFDLVLSSSAIPQIFSGLQYEGEREDKIRESLSELIRVAKKGGEIRIGPMAEYKEDWQREFKVALSRVLDELKKRYRLAVEEKSLGEHGSKYDGEGNMLEKQKLHLLKLYKPSQ